MPRSTMVTRAPPLCRRKLRPKSELILLHKKSARLKICSRTTRTAAGQKLSIIGIRIAESSKYREEYFVRMPLAISKIVRENARDGVVVTSVPFLRVIRKNVRTKQCELRLCLISTSVYLKYLVLQNWTLSCRTLGRHICDTFAFYLTFDA